MLTLIPNTFSSSRSKMPIQGFQKSSEHLLDLTERLDYTDRPDGRPRRSPRLSGLNTQQGREFHSLGCSPSHTSHGLDSNSGPFVDCFARCRRPCKQPSTRDPSSEDNPRISKRFLRGIRGMSLRARRPRRWTKQASGPSSGTSRPHDAAPSIPQAIRSLFRWLNLKFFAFRAAINDTFGPTYSELKQRLPWASSSERTPRPADIPFADFSDRRSSHQRQKEPSF